MGTPITIVAAHVKVFINNKLWKTSQNFTLDVDYGEYEIRGIDCAYPQEIATGQISVKGSLSGIRTKMSGGLQAGSLRPLFSDVAASPYISIRIQDRSTKEDIVFIPYAKVTAEKHSAAIKGKYNLSFNFSGLCALFALDRS